MIDAVFMHNWDARDDEFSRCTVDKDYDSASRLCAHLNSLFPKSPRISLHRVSFVKEYWHRVFEETLKSYASGMETPNPDILCNREIKFGALSDWAKQHSYNTLATGHYAQVHEYKDKRWLMQAADLSKDQSYFLAQVKTDWSSVSFPLGIKTKPRVKKLASELSFDWLLNRKESMGLCFVGKQSGPFSQFMRQFIIDGNKPGELVLLESGKVVGEHDGLSSFTIGQNARVHSVPNRLYVASKDIVKNRIYLVDSLYHPALNTTALNLINFIHSPIDHGGQIFCSIRSQDKIGVKVKHFNTQGTVELEEPTFAPAPGQYAVLYQEHPSTPYRICIGSGKIT